MSDENKAPFPFLEQNKREGRPTTHLYTRLQALSTGVRAKYGLKNDPVNEVSKLICTHIRDSVIKKLVSGEFEVNQAHGLVREILKLKANSTPEELEGKIANLIEEKNCNASPFLDVDTFSAYLGMTRSAGRDRLQVGDTNVLSDKIWSVGVGGDSRNTDNVGLLRIPGCAVAIYLDVNKINPEPIPGDYGSRGLESLLNDSSGSILCHFWDRYIDSIEDVSAEQKSSLKLESLIANPL